MTAGPPKGDIERPTRVLIADDDEGTRILVAEALSDEAAVELIASARDADEAIALVNEVQPDVAVLDWSMPGGGGTVAAEEIKRRHPEVGIIALTGEDPVRASHAMTTAGAVCFLEKGCSTQELVDAIRVARHW